MTRRAALGAGAGAGGFLVLPRSLSRAATGNAAGFTDTEIVLGMSAAFSGPSRGLGIELYRGAAAYFTHVNRAGGVGGRKIVLRTYDDGYQPNPSVENTVRLILKDRVFALLGYVGTPTVTRVLPLLKKFQDEKTYLFFPFTGAQPQRQPPYG
ncbi:MAG: ABC transporter substrate-binding protein, partial [Rhodospirillaceae bacterium]|nr:ABC transporter substrate-binding protein [Rhodospirillaceae bacterium]